MQAAQTCPELRTLSVNAASTAAPISASSITSNGDLPPSSSVIRFMPFAAASKMRCPVTVPPVNEILPTSGCVTSRIPGSAPPCTTFSVPGGRSASSAHSASSADDTGVTSDGFSTAVFPAASAGAIFSTASSAG